MQYQPRTQYAAYHKLVLYGSRMLNAQRRGNIMWRIMQMFAYFIGHYFAYAVHVFAKAHTVILHTHIAQLRHEMVEDTVVL